MDFQENIIAPEIWVSACREGELEINGEIRREPLILGGGSVRKLPENQPQDLTAASFQAALDDGAEVILVGTGVRQSFLPPQLVAELAQRGVGLECMSTAAACRTLSLLQSEGRNVWAWLWI